MVDSVVFLPLNASFLTKRVVDISRQVMIGRSMEGFEAAPDNLRFASKVVSRQHARLFTEKTKLFIQDVGSSSGTFVNGTRLSPQSQQSQFMQINDGDTLKLGEDYNLNGAVHVCIAMKIVFPKQTTTAIREPIKETPTEETEEYVDYSIDAQVRANVQNEFNSVWNSLTHDIPMPFQLKTSDSKGNARDSLFDTSVNKPRGVRNASVTKQEESD